jgi:hypothetical protein
MADTARDGGGREMRLLLATIAVSVGMLLVLARFRFPEEVARPSTDPVPAPLERLAARATFDELAAIMADLERRILPAVVSIGGARPDGLSYVPAVRVAVNRAAALLPAEQRLVGAGTGPAPPIVLRDAYRDLVIVEVPPVPDAVPSFPNAAARPGPRYVAVVEGGPATPSIRPVYVGRTDLLTDPRWSEPLRGVAAVQQSLSPGSAVFSLEGVFIGLVAEHGGSAAIVPSAALRDIAISAQGGPLTRGDLPLDVQQLTTPLARAAGADRGVMVSYVPETLRGTLLAGDVIRAIDGTPVTTVGGFQQVAQSRTPGEPVTLDITRQGQATTVLVTAISAGASRPAVSAQSHGAVVREIPDTGLEVVTVHPGSPAERAGLRRGDVIIAVGTTVPADAASLARAWRDAEAGRALLLNVRRDGGHLMTALEKR